jgi:16S rRNA (cytosine1402-N4)-methyltransferase
MRDEVLEALALKQEGRYLDGTFGRGGHAAAMLERLGANARLLLMDKDLDAIAVAQELAAREPRVRVRHGSFADMAEWDEARQGLDGVLLDLGVSSPQLDEAGRGFSFSSDGPLDMRMDRSRGPSAAEWLARASEREIAEALYAFGDERQSRRLARAIVTTATRLRSCARASSPSCASAWSGSASAASTRRRERSRPCASW